MSQSAATALPVRSPLLISLSGIAALARVQRPVVSAGRQRFAVSAEPFPSPVSPGDSSLRFNAAEVAEWLVSTSHGKNPDAVLDAPAFTDLGLDLGDDSVAELVSALLAVRAASDSSLGDPASLRALATTLDPDDLALSSEINRASDAELNTAARVIESVAEAAFGTRGAQRIIDASRARSAAAPGADGPLTPAALELIVELATALTIVGGTERLISPGAPTISTAQLLGAVIEALTDDHNEQVGLYLDVSRATTLPLRDLARRAVIAGRSDVALSTQSVLSPTTASVALSRLTDSNPIDQLAALESHVLESPDSTSMVVIGPARVLVDAATRDVRAARAHILRTGRVRGVVRLPAGLVPGAPRHALALWVLAPAHADVPIIDRIAVTADLDGIALGEAVRRDLVSDLVASVGSPHTVRAHAFRFARFIRTASLLAGDGSLVATAHDGTVARGVGDTSRGRRVARSQVPALIDDRVAALSPTNPIDAFAVEPTGTSTPATTVTLGALAGDGDVRVLPGTRIRDDQFDVDGFPVIGADLGTGTTRFVDRIRFALEFPAAKLTEPGDVIFVGGATPRAVVDAEGSSVVAAPARVLRLADRSLVPEIVAADIAAVQIRVPWRRWAVRRVPLAQAESIRGAIAAITADRAATRRRLAHLDDLETLLTTGVAAGSITLNPAESPAPTKGAS